VLDAIAGGQLTDGDYEYLIYPPQLKEPYLTRQFRNGEQLYGAMNIARDDAAGRMLQFRRNFEMFGARSASSWPSTGRWGRPNGPISASTSSP